jgi:hypothetical protein
MAHSWRAKTVEALNTGPASRTAFEKYCDHVIDKFFHSYGPLLHPEMQEQARQTLREPVVKFGEFAIQLWSMRSDVRFGELPYFSKRPFALRSDEMRVARAVRLGDYDTSLDGRPIQVVVQPLITAYGTPDGRKYQRRRIWSKAVVWVSSKKGPLPNLTQKNSTVLCRPRSQFPGKITSLARMK